MASPALLGLQDKTDACVANRFPHALSLVADDYENVRCRHDLGCGCNHMGENWFTRNFMQHLGVLRLQPRALAGRHDGNGDAGWVS